jgi:integrase
MAYLYRKKRSPFWYVVYFDGDQKERHRSSGFRADSPDETEQAKALRAELEAKEHHRKPMGESERWDTWVPKYLERHCQSPLTLERYLDAWKWVAFWLEKERLSAPRTITYRKAIEYIDWRTGYKKKTGKRVGRNTAILELKTFATIMAEAMRLGHADVNPLASLKLKRDKPDKKPEMTDEEIIAIDAALKEEPEWMQISFAIALHTGCRLRETRIPLHCIDFRKGRITFPTPKGGESRAFSIPLPTALRPLLEKLKAKGQEYTLEFPFQPSRRWGQFLEKIKKAHLCFHCLRVTHITRLWRDGVPMDAAMRLVNHASELIHKIYQREKVDDVMKWRDKVQFPV